MHKAHVRRVESRMEVGLADSVYVDFSVVVYIIHMYHVE